MSNDETMTKKRSAEIGTLLFVFRHSCFVIRLQLISGTPMHAAKCFSPQSPNLRLRETESIQSIGFRIAVTAFYFAIPPVGKATDIRRNPLPSISPPERNAARPN